MPDGRLFNMCLHFILQMVLSVLQLQGVLPVAWFNLYIVNCEPLLNPGFYATHQREDPGDTFSFQLESHTGTRCFIGSATV